MKKLLQSLFILMLVASAALAQDRTVTGTVIAKEDGLPLPGVSVKVKGTTTGTQTGADGKFSIKVTAASPVLQFSFIGYKAVEAAVPASNKVNVSLASDSRLLEEVTVIGALGTKRTARSTTNNAQVIDEKQLNTIRQTNLNNALAGKVSGIQVRSQSAAALGRNTEVRLRGVSGFGTGTSALYIVNGTVLPNADDINLDDIENVSVLQGAAAAAQFGSQGANGAIIITLKEGKSNANGNLGVTVNTGIQFEDAYILPNYQNSYAGGGVGDLMQYTYKAGDPVEWQALSGKFYHDYSDDASWGPRMVGQEHIPWYAWYGGHDRAYKTTALNPQPNNARDFYNTGVTRNSSVSLSTATDKLKFKFTYGNQDISGLMYNSELKKNTVNLISSYKLNDKFEVSADINYINQIQKGEVDDGYSNQTTGSFSQWFHRDLDMGIIKELQHLRTPDGVYASWNHANPNTYDASNPREFFAGNYWYNFYTYFNLVDVQSQRDRLYGNLALTYKFNKDLKITATYRKQQNTTFGETKYSSQLATSGLQTSGNNPETLGYYGTSTSYSNRRNLEFLASYTKKIKDFSIEANVGADFFRWVSKSNSAGTNNGLSVADLFTIANSVDQPTVGNGRTEEKYRAVLAKGTFGYKNILFADITLRNDWFSTLPAGKNGVVSKSFGGSFVFGDMLAKTLPFVSFGKLRGSWGEIPKALGGSNETFGAYRYPGSAFGVGSFKWGSNFLMGASDVLVDPNIRGSVVTQGEYGIDLGFLNDRLGFSATYWKGSEKDFPYALTVNGASGYTSLLTNIGEISKSGIDIQFNAKPVISPNFSWKVNATWSKLVTNDVVSLSPEYGITQTAGVQGVWGSTMPYMVHKEGMRWGQIFGNGIKMTNGQPTLTSTGAYENDPAKYFGSVLPDYTGGLQNSFTFLKDFSLNVNIDFQSGGKFVSLSNMWGSFSGLTAQTATYNDKGNPIRDAVADGGGVHVFGVNAAGTPVNYYVGAQDYFHNLYYNKTFDPYIYDLTFVKMREVSLGYNIPVKKLGLSKFIQNANLAIVARNPLLIYATSKDFDPSEISATVGETGQFPGTRGFGFNLRVGF
jgi:TonB-linked SusC/RagA family outer membrane protein